MPRELPDDYFSRPPFARTGGFRFDGYTCNGCSQRLKTWPAFKEHVTRCPGDDRYRHGARVTGSTPRTASAPLSEEDMGALADLLRQVDEDVA